MKRTLYTLAAALVLTASASAQTLHESIDVQGTYKPDIITPDRIAMLPASPMLHVATPDLAYSYSGVAAQFSPDILPLPAILHGADRPDRLPKGYVTAALGSWLNSDLSAGYRFIDTKTSLLGASLQFNSTSLYKPEGFDVARERYDGTLGIYGAHSFEGAGTLSGQLDYRLACFNYAPVDLQQTLNNLRAALRFDNPIASRLRWYAALDYEYFAYRRLYLPGHDAAHGLRESHLQARGGLNLPWEGGSNLGIDARADLLLYNKPVTPWPSAQDYGQIELTPYYRFSRGLLNIRVGAHIDFTFNAAGSSYPLLGIHDVRQKYAWFHISPDVTLDYRREGVGIYLHAGGGSRLQTLANASKLDYYGMPGLANTTPSYSPLDAEIGATFGPFSGFSATLAAAYRIASYVPGGWYMALLTNTAPVPDICGRDICLNGWRFSADIRYSLSRILDFRAAASWQTQSGEQGFFNGYDRPRWLVDVSADVRPIDPLCLSVGFDYRGVRALYGYRLLTPAGSVPALELYYRSLPDLCNLHASASWQLTDRLNIFGRLDNILNRRNMFLFPGEPEGGLNFMLGININL